MSRTPLPGSRYWIALQGIAALTLVAAGLLIGFLGSSLTPVNYSAQFGSVPAHLSSCAYIVPRSPAGMPGTRGPPRGEAMCFFGSRGTHPRAYVAAWVAFGLGSAVLVWTVVTGRGLRLTARRR